MERFAIRVRSFEDQDSYRRVCDLLVGLYPDRPRSEFERALARLPCLLTDDADPRAANALRRALEARGASVRMFPAGALEPPGSGEVAPHETASQEVDMTFFRSQMGRQGPVTGSARAVPTAVSFEHSQEWSVEKAPWED